MNAESIHGRNFVDELVISLFRIRKDHSSRLGPDMGQNHWNFLCIPLRQITEPHLESDDNRLLPHPFQFIIHHLLYPKTHTTTSELCRQEWSFICT